MTYIDGFIVAVPKKNITAYKKMARLAGKVWMEHGALQYIESIEDDVPKGKWTSFPRAVKLKPSEVVVFSYVVYKSRKERDRIMKWVMADKRLAKFMDPKAMPFDGKRMIWGGFKTMISL